MKKEELKAGAYYMCGNEKVEFLRFDKDGDPVLRSLNPENHRPLPNVVTGKEEKTETIFTLYLEQFLQIFVPVSN